MALQDTRPSKSKGPRTAQARCLGPGLSVTSSSGTTSSGGVDAQGEVCRTDLVMGVGQGKTPSYGANFVPTTGDVPPSAGKCRYDKISPSGSLGELPEKPHLQLIFSSLSALGESELWLFCEEKFTLMNLGCQKKTFFFFTLAKQ